MFSVSLFLESSCSFSALFESSSFSSWATFSLRNCILVASSTISFTKTRFVTFAALFANESDFFVSSTNALDGVIVTITTVLEFPPKAGCKIRVNFESRKGMCDKFLFCQKIFNL
ncbi:hypothetical protein MHBO_001073 [Bonamia ostreae]|uniref:Uncharacterized protein n=1 Tax=Bonamia ostreae TaxID=126728 RepID=A0ABV2AHX8_9EUKA